ncbi:MAG: YciI family protein [Clostridia bacterium]|nr:YciI family protein [Clostridia bacterium]
MLFMLIVKASKNSENKNLPNETLRQAMSKYNEDLREAGVRVMAKGLHPSSEGIRFYFPEEGCEPVMKKGPFENVNELVAGFFLIDVGSKEEAIEWAKKVPDPQGNGEGQVELRQVFQ